LVEILIAHGIPCAPVRPVSEVAADPELEQRGLIRDGEFDGQPIKVLGSAIKLSGVSAGEGPTAVARLGQDTAEVLRRLGLGDPELHSLRRGGVIG